MFGERGRRSAGPAGQQCVCASIQSLGCLSDRLDLATCYLPLLGWALGDEVSLRRPRSWAMSCHDALQRTAKEPLTFWRPRWQREPSVIVHRSKRVARIEARLPAVALPPLTLQGVQLRRRGNSNRQPPFQQLPQ